MKIATGASHGISRQRVLAWVRKKSLNAHRDRSPRKHAHNVAEVVRNSHESTYNRVRLLIEKGAFARPGKFSRLTKQNFAKRLRLYKDFRKRAYKQIPEVGTSQKVYALKHELNKIAQTMEINGARIDVDFAKELVGVFMEEQRINRYLNQGKKYFLSEKHALSRLAREDSLFYSVFRRKGVPESEWQKWKARLIPSVARRLVGFNPLRKSLPRLIVELVTSEYEKEIGS